MRMNLTYEEDIMRNILPLYLSIGVSEERFWDGTPKDLKPFVDAHNMRTEEKDIENWRLGMYMQSAFSSAYLRANGVKDAEYIDAPILSKTKEKNKKLTENEKQNMRKNFLLSLQAMQANFEINRKFGEE